ncbi:MULTISPECIES: helix-turn-helix transcriptional regulator [Saliphagus]|uniref:Helix-turn-helix transcriptional regulator n=1 Tax=Saliphagus infecundisoli TaxID=1849069 RepID=A0ABD5QA25_9EURY|nr:MULTISPECIES: hypothetical protein [Saliphagus]
MVLDTLRSLLADLREREPADVSSENTTEAGHESYYADRVEYGVNDRDLPEDDRVLRLLVERGGRVERSTIVGETGWSEERLEACLDRMEREGQVSAIDVGGRRVVCRRGFEPKGYRPHLTSD